MKEKYIPKTKGTKAKGDGKPGRYINPATWSTGPDIVTREKYYAFLKHRSQAIFRKETYELTWEDWQKLWTNDLFERRGRNRDSLCLSRKVLTESWNLNNCVITERYNHLKRAKEFRNREP